MQKVVANGEKTRGGTGSATGVEGDESQTGEQQKCQPGASPSARWEDRRFKKDGEESRKE